MTRSPEPYGWRDIERWRPVRGWSHYEVSDRGRVRTLDGRILGQWLTHGYMRVRLSRPRRTIDVHRLVGEAFVPNPNGKPYINHIDCDKCNNQFSNLEWCTQFENLRHAEQLGRMRRDYWRGRRTPVAALTNDQVREMRLLYAAGNWSWERLGKKFNVSKRSAGRAITGETYADVK